LTERRMHVCSCVLLCGIPYSQPLAPSAAAKQQHLIYYLLHVKLYFLTVLH
jgi:hypothetical protein